MTALQGVSAPKYLLWTAKLTVRSILTCWFHYPVLCPQTSPLLGLNVFQTSLCFDKIATSIWSLLWLYFKWTEFCPRINTVPLCGGVQCHTVIWVCITRSRCSECNCSTLSSPAGQCSRHLPRLLFIIVWFLYHQTVVKIPFCNV